MSIMSLIILTLIIILLIWVVKERRVVWSDHSNFNNVSVGLCAILTLAWGAYTFDALNQRDKAAVELKELQDKIKGTESTFFSIDVKTEHWDNGYYLLPVVTVKNSGTNPIHIRMGKDSLTVKKVLVKDDKVKAVSSYHPKFYEVISNDDTVKHTPLYDMIIPISAERKINYALNVNEPGLYYLTFQASTINEKGTEETKEVNGMPVIWFASKYFFVQ